MRALTLLSIILLSLFGLGIYKMNKTEEQYHERLGRIADHINSMNLSWKASKPSKFANVQTVDEVKRWLGTKLEGSPVTLPDVSEVQNLDLEDVPAAFDSRDAWPKCDSIKEVRDQSNCGSCWAFGAAEAMSDRVCIHSGQTLQTRISTQDLLTCCYSCGDGCDGGYPSAAWDYWVRTGLVTGDLYGNNQWCAPYSFAPCAHHVTSAKYPPCTGEFPTPACVKTCNPSYPKSYASDKQFGSNAYNVPGAKKMMAEISTNGPIEISMSVYEDFLTYK